MPRSEERKPLIDWSLTPWEGSRREQLRRWAALLLEEIKPGGNTMVFPARAGMNLTWLRPACAPGED